MTSSAPAILAVSDSGSGALLTGVTEAPAHLGSVTFTATVAGATADLTATFP